MQNTKFEDLIHFLNNKKILITSHNLVDLDGFVSSIVLQYSLKEILEKAQVKVFFPEISKSTKGYQEKFKGEFPNFDFSVDQELNLSEIEIILILDTNKTDQIDLPWDLQIWESKIPYIFIDHHFFGEKNYPGNQKNLNLIFEDFSSTAEIIFEICKYFNLSLPSSYKTLLISGILTDSGFFKYGNNDTVYRVSELLDKKVEFQEILQLLKGEVDISEKIAKIKGLQRVKIIKEDNWLIGTTKISSFEASVATTLIKVGFDIAIVISDKKTHYRISTRANKHVCSKKNLHLGKLLEEVSSEIEANGGGHDGAAAINGKDSFNTALDRILEKIKQILNN